jgi:superfamily II DNA or RNA helicase
VLPYIIQFGYDIDIVDERQAGHKVPKKRAITTQFEHIIGYGGLPTEVRPYQVDVVNSLLDSGDGIALCATGAGKTLMCASLCDIFSDANQRVIIVVPSADLVDQTYEALAMFGLSVGRYSGDNKELTAKHTVATWQSLQHHPEILIEQGYSCIIIDECHGGKNSEGVIQKLLVDYGKNISFRFGLTGTLPKAPTELYAIKSVLGQVVATVTARWLIDNGYLAELEIQPIVVQDDVEQLPDYASEKGWLSNNRERIQAIADNIIADAAKYGNTLVLVDSLKFGRALEKAIPGSIFMYGATEKKDRKEKYAEFDDRNDLIVICNSQIASTGISIDRIFHLALVDIGKSFIKAIQSVGRGLRKSKDKWKVYVKDYSSSLKYSTKHKKERIKWYKEAEYDMIKEKKLKY